MKTTFYLLKYKGVLSIYMVSELDAPPLMDTGILSMWVTGQHEEYLLPFGCSEIKVGMKPDGYKPKTDIEGVEILETYYYTPSLPMPKPSWLQESQERLDDPVERFMLIGDPTIYTHLVPIKDLEPEPFVSVDPLTNPEFLEGGIKERVLVTGCFDLFHAGHAHFLSQVYKHYVGEYRELHVGLADDTSFAYLKKRKPIYPLEQRLAILESVKCVAKVHTFQVWVDVPGGLPGVEDGHRYLLDTVKPVLFVDSRQKPKERIGALPYLKEKSIPIKYVDSIGIHTCDILKGIKE